jgi:hypothetical protein
MGSMITLRPFLLPAALAALAGGLTASPALARNEPKPVPSGIVVHLFGPQTVTNGPVPSPGAPAGTPGTAAQAGVSGGTDSAGTISSGAAASSPTWGEIAHEMFVTGDPAQENRSALPKGRSTEH